MANKTETIRVAIRCRPLSEQERKDNREIVVQMLKETGEVIIKKPEEDVPKVFTFDSVYDWNSEQETVYTELAFPIIDFVV